MDHIIALRAARLLTMSLVGRLVRYSGDPDVWYAIYEISEDMTVRIVDPRWSVGTELAAFEAGLNGSHYRPLYPFHNRLVAPSEIGLP